MPSDLSRRSPPLWASPRPPPNPTLHTRQHSSSHRLPPVFKFSLCCLALLCGLAWFRTDPRELAPLSGRELAGYEAEVGKVRGAMTAEARQTDGSHYDALQAFMDRRVSRAKHGLFRDRHHQDIFKVDSPSQPTAVVEPSITHPPPEEVLEDDNTQVGTDVKETKGAGGLPALQSSPNEQKMALFLMWPKGIEYSSTSSFLLQSFLASSSSEIANLIILIRGDASTCLDHARRITDEKKAILEVNASLDKNAEVVCMDDAEYWAHHKDFLCAGWDCSEEEEDKVLQTMMDRDADDPKDDQFRLLRGLVFDSFLPPDVKWWGWVGGDVYLGNLQRKFPWDIAPNFDVVVPNGVSLNESTSAALSTKLAFFQRRTSTSDLLRGFPSFRTLKKFLSDDRASLQDFSDYVFSTPKLDLFTYEAYIRPSKSSSLARALTQTGVHSIFLPPSSSSSHPIPALSKDDKKGYLGLLNKPRVAPHLIGTFTDNASVQPLKADGHFEFPPLLSDKDARSFKDETVWIYRLDGRVVERREARSVHQDKSFVVNEWLFDIARNHQTNRPQPPPYPPNRLRKGHALVFLPDPSSSSSTHSIKIKEEIWDDPARPETAVWWEAPQYLPTGLIH